MSQTAEVVVVGGGVNGASIAYALAAKGVKVNGTRAWPGPASRCSGTGPS